MLMPLRLLFLGLCAATVVAAEKPVPRLAVLIAVDQMRADFLVKFRPYFGEGGFKRLLLGGANYPNCHYQHAISVTAPGHATILSGVNANVHGIIANDWKDPQTLQDGNAVEDSASPLVGLPPHTGRYPNATLAAKAGRSPRNFLGTTVGDRLKARYGAAARVFGVADKDRSAILMAGTKADGAYWTEEGRFVTSTFYRPELPAWVEKFNSLHNLTHKFGQVWDRLLEPEIYERVQGPDDATGEYSGMGLTRIFPKRFDGGKSVPSNEFLGILDVAPWSNDLVAGLAEKLVEVERLGDDATPDLLCVGFSQPDGIGHAYGPDSHEVMDSYLRLDQVLARFLAFLDRKVGRENYLLVLTADHGVGPIPEQTQEKLGAASAGRIIAAEISAHVNAALDAVYGPLPADHYWTVRDASGFRLNARALEAKNVSLARAATEVRQAVLKFPGIAEAWTREQLLSDQPLAGFGERMRLSYHAERSPDVMVVIKRYWLPGTTQASHGTPYDYDTHVPQLWFGAGIKPVVHPERVAVEDIAPTLAGLLGVDLPEAKGRRLF